MDQVNEQFDDLTIEEVKPKENTIFNLGVMLGIEFFMAKELHFAILDLYCKVLSDGGLYCFCDEYQGCENYYWQKRYCPLCRIPTDLEDTEKLCDYAQFDFVKLCQIAMNFVRYLKGCFEVKDSRYLLDLFNMFYVTAYLII